MTKADMIHPDIQTAGKVTLSIPSFKLFQWRQEVMCSREVLTFHELLLHYVDMPHMHITDTAKVHIEKTLRTSAANIANKLNRKKITKKKFFEGKATCVSYTSMKCLMHEKHGENAGKGGNNM